MDQWITVDGRHIDIGAGGAGTPLSKSEKAKLAYKGGDKREQDIAEETERQMAETLGMPRTPDNRAFDLQSRKYGVEVKTMISNGNGKITMNTAARMRKAQQARDLGLKTATLVVDKRTSTTRYFVKAGFGSFRVDSMTEIKSASSLKAAVYRMAS